jgi:hypothetical protein
MGWNEFLDFFFAKDLKMHERNEGQEWWDNLDADG